MQQIDIIAVTVIWFALLLVLFSVRIAVLQLRGTYRPKSGRLKTKRLKVQPLLSVIVTSQNNQDYITTCLESIRKSSIKKIEVFVIDNVSRDGSIAAIKEYIAAHPACKIRLIRRRKSATGLNAKQLIKTTGARGEIVLIISARHRLDRLMLQNLRQLFHADQSLGHINIRPHINFEPKLGTLLDTAARILKIPSARNTEVSLSGNPDAYARRNKTVLKADFTSSKTFFTKELSFGGSKPSHAFYAIRTTALAQIFLAMFSLSVIAGIMYAAISRNPVYFLIVWAGSGLLYIFSLVASEQLRLTHKLRVALYAPMSYLYFLGFGVIWTIELFRRTARILKLRPIRLATGFR